MWSSREPTAIRNLPFRCWLFSMPGWQTYLRGLCRMRKLWEPHRLQAISGSLLVTRVIMEDCHKTNFVLSALRRSLGKHHIRPICVLGLDWLLHWLRVFSRLYIILLVLSDSAGLPCYEVPSPFHYMVLC